MITIVVQIVKSIFRFFERPTPTVSQEWIRSNSYDRKGY